MEKTRRISENYSLGVKPVAESTDDYHWQFNSMMQWISHLKVQAPADSPTGLFTEACRHGTALYLFIPFEHHFPDPTLVLNALLHKLKFALKSLVPNLGPESSLLVWLLAVAGVTSLNTPEHDWFVGHLVPLVDHLDIRSWEDFTAALESIMYIRKFIDHRFLKLWEYVQLTREISKEHNPYTSMVLASRLGEDFVLEEGFELTGQ